jgi:flagellar motor switch protein FliN
MSSENASNPSRNAPETTVAQMIDLGELHGDDAPAGAKGAVLDNANPLHAIRTRLQVCVGGVELSVGELIAAHEHQVLVLDRTIDHPVDMLLEGKVVARGQLVAVDGYFAVRITDLPAPLKA